MNHLSPSLFMTQENDAPKPIPLPIRVCPSIWKSMRARPDFQEMLDRNGLKESDYLVIGLDDLPATPASGCCCGAARGPKAAP